MTLPINASQGDSDPTKWKVSKYLLTNDYQTEVQESAEPTQPKLTTMDAIRIFHREIGGYLTVTRRNIEAHLPEYPDFLKKEVSVLAEEKDDLEEDEDDELVIDEGKAEQEILIHIEKDNTKLDKTNSLWEIQKVGSVSGDVLHTNESYLIRHMATGMYLSTSDNIELCLTSQGTNPENEFRFNDEQMFETIKSVIHENSCVSIQNIDEKFIQTYSEIHKDEFTYTQSRSITTEVPIVCGFKHSKELTKEAFIFEKANDELKTYTQKSFSIYFYLLDSYRFINQWAVIREEEDGEEYDKYDEIMATTSEEHLQERANEVSSVLDLLIQDLNDKEHEELNRIQTYYAEQGIVEMLVKLGELNFYKSTRVEERVEDLVGKSQFRRQAVRNLINDNIGEDEIRPEHIADEYLTELNDKILRVIYLLIRYNTENCNIMTKYDQLIYMLKELPLKDDFTSFKPRICKILTETFKRADFIYQDKAAIMAVEDGLDYDAITTRLVAEVTTTADKKVINQMQKWLDMLDMIYFTAEDEHNMYQQILYLKIVTMFWVKHSRSAYSKRKLNQGSKNQNNNNILSETISGHKRYQLLAGKFIFASEKSIPLKFGYEHRATEIPYVTFSKRGGKGNEFFLDRNPILEELFRADAGNENQDNSFTLEELSDHEKILMPYIDYICAVVELYAYMCMDGHISSNIEAVNKCGISFTHAMSVLKNDKIHIKLRNSYSFLIRILFLNVEPFISIVSDTNK